MSDGAIRALERTQDPASKAQLLNQKLRVGLLTSDRVNFSAALGDEASRLLLGQQAPRLLSFIDIQFSEIIRQWKGALRHFPITPCLLVTACIGSIIDKKQLTIPEVVRGLGYLEARAFYDALYRYLRSDGDPIGAFRRHVQKYGGEWKYHDVRRHYYRIDGFDGLTNAIINIFNGRRHVSNTIQVMQMAHRDFKLMYESQQFIIFRQKTPPPTCWVGDEWRWF